MTHYSHHVVGFGPGSGPNAGAGRREAVFAQIQATGLPAITARGGRLFALFKPLIGLSLNHAILISEWPDEAGQQRTRDLC